MAGYCPDAFASPGLKARFFDALFKASDWTASWSLPLSRAKETNILLLFRTLANVFQEGTIISDGAWVQQVINIRQFAMSGSSADRLMFLFSCLGIRNAKSGTISIFD